MICSLCALFKGEVTGDRGKEPGGSGLIVDFLSALGGFGAFRPPPPGFSPSWNCSVLRKISLSSALKSCSAFLAFACAAGFSKIDYISVLSFH
jgi:hypothetical protein